MKPELIDDFAQVAARPGPDIAAAALRIAYVEYPFLDASKYVALLDVIGGEARHRVSAAAAPGRPAGRRRIEALNDYLFGELRFSGNTDHYDDPRNSFLNEVLERRTGIPITLSVVYIEVGRRAGIALEGVNFPGHFLVRHRQEHPEVGAPNLLLDPFNGGAGVSDEECGRLVREYLGEEATLEPHFVETASKPQILVRMLLNLKRVYVRMRSFPQARDVTDLLLRIDPAASTELRDRGLIAYHLNDFPAALRDLEEYLRRRPSSDAEAAREDQKQVWEHVKTLRRRVAELN